MIVASALSLLAIPTTAPARSSASVTCAIAITPLRFGEYVPFLGAAADFTAVMTVTCTTTAMAAEPWEGTVALVGAGGPGGRQLTQGTHPLDYRLYSDASRTLPWGDDSGEGAKLPLSAMVGPTMPLRQTIVVYGRIPARQTAAPVGRYFDQITALLEY